MFSDLIHFIINGGFFMLPLGICSVVSLAFILERFVALRRINILPVDLVTSIVRLRIGQDTEMLADMAGPGRSTLARLVRVSLEHLPWSRSENVEAVQTQARTEVIRMERGLVVLEIITGISPMLGLLGTVSGLITIFANIGDVGLGDQGMIIAKGISEALNTTVAGLVVAIPSLIAHSYYSRNIESMMMEMESLTMDLIAKLYLQAETEE
ncbi:MAG: MotA/TolQ/ExbB proton channel family protein [Verrucomicrobiota bacterium]